MEQNNLSAVRQTPLYWVGQEAVDACTQLDTYLTALGDHLETVRAQHRLRADREHQKRLADLDPTKVDSKDHEVRKECEYLFKSEKEWYERQKEKQDRAIVQMAWNSFIVSCWATYEMYFERLGEYVREEKNIKLRSNKIKGDKNSRLKDYFSDVLSIPLAVDKNDFGYLDNLYLVRNAVAHGNGNIEEVFEQKQKTLRDFVLKNRNIEISGQYLYFEKPFAEESLVIVSRVLKQINNAVRSEFGYFQLR